MTLARLDQAQLTKLQKVHGEVTDVLQLCHMEHDTQRFMELRINIICALSHAANALGEVAPMERTESPYWGDVEQRKEYTREGI